MNILIAKVHNHSRSWARNEGTIPDIKKAMEAEPNLKVTLPNFVYESLLS